MRAKAVAPPTDVRAKAVRHSPARDQPSSLLGDAPTGTPRSSRRNQAGNEEAHAHAAGRGLRQPARKANSREGDTESVAPEGRARERATKGQRMEESAQEREIRERREFFQQVIGGEADAVAAAELEYMQHSHVEASELPRTQRNQTCYEILSVGEDATPQEIRSRFAC